MRIAIVGAGFTGLTAGFDLVKAGHKVEIFETYGNVGGLAGCEKINGFYLERCYHHLFQTDRAIRRLVAELGLAGKLKFQKTNDAVFLNGKIYPFSSPLNLLTLDPLSIVSRFRLAATVAFLKLYPNWQTLQGQTAKDWIEKWAGKQVYKKLWQPLLIGKFGQKQVEKIAAPWFWARISARTQKLGYFEGGFEIVASALAQKIQQAGSKVKLKEPVIAIEKAGKRLRVKSTQKEEFYDKAIYTAPIAHFPQIAKDLPKSYSRPLLRIKFLHAQCLVLIVKRPLTPYYWLNIGDPTFPFLLIVEQTNFVPSSCYGGQKIIYIGNYLLPEDWRWRQGKAELTDLFLPYLKKINSKFSEADILESFLFRGAHAQPIVDVNYKQLIPPLTTPIKNLYLATMAQVYPYDRGTNYAVVLGHQVANLILGKRREKYPIF